MKTKLPALACVSLITLLAFGITAFLSSKEPLIIKGVNCQHDSIQEYYAVVPTLSENGENHHYACCECHSAFSDSDYTNCIGNTVTDRSKLTINKKTNAIETLKSSVLANDDIVNAIETNPYVVGLDQTNWGSYPNGKGSGTFKYYEIDEKIAIKASSIDLTNSQHSIINSYNSGYSEIRFAKSFSGSPFANFSYKIFDVDNNSYASGKVIAEWMNNNTVVASEELTLALDNAWHDYHIAVNESKTVTSLKIKIKNFKGELYISNLVIDKQELDAPKLVQDGLKIKFNSVAYADYYLIHDDNNNPNEIRIEDSEKVNNVITYAPKVAGMHNIYVTAHREINPGSYSTSNIISDLEIAPVFFYDNFANEYYVGKDYFESRNTAWYSIYRYDGEIYNNRNKFEFLSESNYYHSYYTNNGFSTNASERLEYTTYEEGSNLYRIIEEAKELGTNVLYVPHSDGVFKGGSFEQQVELKSIMDHAYENNLKVVALANQIYGASADSTSSESEIRTKVNNFLNGDGLALIQHPAFYGFALYDEPLGDYLNSVSYTAKACLDFFRENYDSKNLSVKRPFFLCALLQYSDGALFESEDYYKDQYIGKWLNITGLNYYSTDIYTYTTTKYSQDEVIDTNYRLFMELKSEYSNLKMHLTVTANNDIDIRSSCNKYDIFGSTLYAAAFNNYGISRYTYFPAIWTYHWKNGVVNRDGSKTDKYNYVKEAQKQFSFMQDLLYGYEVTSLSTNSIGGYDSKKANTRTMAIELSDGINYVNAYVNYNSQSNYNSTYNVFVPNGKTYYLFGEGKALTPNISTGMNIVLNNGEAVLVLNEIPEQRDVVMSANDFVSNFGEIGSDTTGMSISFTENILSLNITGNNPASWLNKNIYGVDRFVDYLHASSGFDVVFKSTAGLSSSIKTVMKVGDAYPSMTFNGPTTTGGWDTISVNDYNPSLTDIRIEFLGQFAGIGKEIQIKDIVFRDVEGSYLTSELKRPAYVIDKLSQISGFDDASSVTITSNGQFDKDMSFAKDVNNSYMFKFRYSMHDLKDSLFIYIGCKNWFGFEFIILSDRRTQIDILNENGTRLDGTGAGLYAFESDTEYLIELHVIRLYGNSNKVFLGFMVNGMYWNQILTDDSSAFKNNCFGMYDFDAENGAGNTLSDY